MTLTVNGITKSPPYKIDAGSFNMKDIVKLDDKTGQRMRAMEDQLKSMDPMGRKKKLDELSQVVEGTGTVVTIQLSTKDETTPNQANCEQSEALQPNSPANKRKAQLENPQQIKKPKVNHQRQIPLHLFTKISTIFQPFQIVFLQPFTVTFFKFQEDNK
ncbi:hypothetical protein MJO28_013732 [Puccinia striiformis f. sp. tritici]|uniref:Uncharacterized protein n=1 Tax=Puccinia striiformis f. sp. tritici TaxID=168172 RepID=A0ACC0DVU1_9BASI|nr:hypothetical protein MJO28_013732 [Puccinia striiformis f. sp. tritici]